MSALQVEMKQEWLLWSQAREHESHDYRCNKPNIWRGCLLSRATGQRTRIFIHLFVHQQMYWLAVNELPWHSAGEFLIRTRKAGGEPPSSLEAQVYEQQLWTRRSLKLRIDHLKLMYFTKITKVSKSIIFARTHRKVSWKVWERWSCPAYYPQQLLWIWALKTPP